MARFHGAIGYNLGTEEDPPDSGVWVDKIVERMLTGDVITNTRQLQETENLNDDLSVGNSISILADAYAMDNYFAIKYVVWNGGCWTVPSVTVQRPRFLLQLGGIYNGPKPTA